MDLKKTLLLTVLMATIMVIPAQGIKHTDDGSICTDCGGSYEPPEQEEITCITKIYSQGGGIDREQLGKLLTGRHNEFYGKKQPLMSSYEEELKKQAEKSNKLLIRLEQLEMRVRYLEIKMGMTPIENRRVR